MDKTHRISLGGFSFLIEEKAYQELSSYLHSVRASLKNNPDTEEIIYDVEQRMAELLPPKMAGRQVIIPSDVDFLIAKLGRPEQYIDEDFSAENPTFTSEEKNEKFSLKNKKLYRDMENKKLGGVLSGLSYYLNIDVAWVRFIYLFLFMFSQILFALDKLVHWQYHSIYIGFSGFWLMMYIVFWVIVPPAMTTAEKLEMKGKSVNINTISFFKDEANALTSKLYRSRRNRLLGGVLGGISDMMAWEVTWVRIVFILLFLGFVPFVTQISGYITILYILIWIAVPSEKRNSIFDKNPSEDNSEEKTTEKNHFFSGNVASEENTKVTENQSYENETHQSSFWGFMRLIFKGFAYLVVGFIAFILLIMGLSIGASLLGVGVSVWGIGFTSLAFADFLPYLVNGDWQLWLGYASGILLLLLPISVICILALKLFSKNGYQTPRFWILANVFMFFFGIVGLTIVIIDTIKAVKSTTHYEERISLPANDTLSLSYEVQPVNRRNVTFINLGNFEFEDNNLVIEDRNTRFYVRKTTEKEPFIILRKFARGRTLSQAKINAEKIDYRLKISGNSIALPHLYSVGENPKIRGQEVDVYLYLPENKYITSPSEELSVWEEASNKWINISRGGIAKMTKEGLVKE